jgi:hypothetical protein
MRPIVIGLRVARRWSKNRCAEAGVKRVASHAK